MAVICACVASYRLAVARLAEPAAREGALIVVDRLERGRVLACDDDAHALGARTGMTLVQASSRAREAYIAVDDPARNAALWEATLDELDAVSPLVEDHAPGVAFLDMRGMPGDPQRWIDAARAALAQTGVPFRIACAANSSTAHLIALADDGAVVAAGDEAARLAPLPLRVLDVPSALEEALALLGVTTLGHLAALPHGDFVRRFGPAAAGLHERARGIHRTPIAPRPRAVRIERACFGEGSAESEEQVLFALRSLLVELVADLAAAGMRCGRLRVFIECEDGETRELVVGVARPTAQDAILMDLVRAKLEGSRFTAPITGLRLGAEALEEGGGALSLFRGDDPDLDRIATTIARLCGALSADAVVQPHALAAHRREARFCDVPVDARLTRTGYVRMAAPSQRATMLYRIVPRRALRVHCAEGIPISVEARKVLDAAGPWRYDERWWTQAVAGNAAHEHGEEYDVLLDNGALWRIAREHRAWFLRGMYD